MIADQRTFSHKPVIVHLWPSSQNQSIGIIEANRRNKVRYGLLLRSPICQEDETPEDKTLASPEDTTPISPEDTTPVSPEERIPIHPDDTTPNYIHGRHWMSFCSYLCRVPDGVTKIGKGYVCGMYKQNILRPEEYHQAYCLSLLGDMDVEVNEATQVAFKSLLMASLFDPSSSGPFNVHPMNNGKSTLMEERQTFIETTRTYYDSIRIKLIGSFPHV
ncbi:hypothetical protein DVH24_033521 [Malus domestica]|uniref:Uncharacterized protein n=1 Tax=Malus domestica TaxID=3750 RepID=A0A498JCQ9_MALDO|nr:hypothetical protein DVH24_033521 [Malus domestica]